MTIEARALAFSFPANMLSSDQTSTTPPAFPENLPPRTTPPQRRRANIRTCYTFAFFRSYNARHSPDHRTRARRVFLNINLSLCIGTILVADVFVALFNSNARAGATVLGILDLFISWLVGWSFALIGDAASNKWTVSPSVSSL